MAGSGDDTSAVSQKSSWFEEGLDLVRAISGGLLFGVPLLYTMEVWWIGSYTEPARMLVILAMLFGLLLALNKSAGFRVTQDVRWSDALQDTIEAIAIGLLSTLLVLYLLRRITFDTPMRSALGQVINESLPFCLGVGVARFVLKGERTLDDDESGSTKNGRGEDETREMNATIADVGATVLGASFVGLSIAPTDEIPTIAAAMGPWWQSLVLLFTLVVCYAIVFAAGFSGQDRRIGQAGAFQQPITETMAGYLVSLSVAAVLLWVFQRNAGLDSDFLARTIVLGLPTAVGGAVGRLAV